MLGFIALVWGQYVEKVLTEAAGSVASMLRAV